MTNSIIQLEPRWNIVKSKNFSFPINVGLHTPPTLIYYMGYHNLPPGQIPNVLIGPICCKWHDSNVTFMIRITSDAMVSQFI